MTVRKITKTTLSVIILIIGFVFFRKYYIGLLLKLLNSLFHIENYAFIIIGRLFPQKYIGAYFPALFYFGVMVIIIARIIDAILGHKVALSQLSSFSSPLFLTVLVTIALCINKINILQLWAIFYLCLIICLHSTFKKIILHSEFVGKYANLKLIKGFFLTIKDAVLKVISTGIGNFGNPVDEITVLSASTVVLLLEVAAVISYGIYLAAYWRLIFLSYLIN